MENNFFMLHGYGANADDLKPLASYFGSDRIKFHFPDAPIDLSAQFPLYNARAWFEIDVNRLNQYHLSGKSFDLSQESPPSLDKALEYLKDYIDKRHDPESGLVLGGFSQGSMCSYHFYRKYKEQYKFKALVLLSSNLLDVNFLNQFDKSFDIPIFQSHGTSDPVLPYEGAEKLKDFMKKNGGSIQFESFAGGHEIPIQVLEKLKNFLETKII